MQMNIDLPPSIDQELKRLWIQTAGQAFKEIAQRQQAKQYMTQKEASEYLGISVNSFKKFAVPRVALDNIVRYRKADLDKFMEENKI